MLLVYTSPLPISKIKSLFSTIIRTSATSATTDKLPSRSKQLSFLDEYSYNYILLYALLFY